MIKRVVLIVCLALLIRLLLLLAIYNGSGSEGFFLSDSWGFYQTGINLLSGHGFSQETAAPFIPGSRFPPFYPFLIAISVGLSGSIVPLLLLQVTLASLTVLFVWKIGFALSNNYRAANFAAFLMAFEPLSIYLSTTLLTDTIATFLGAAGIFLLTRVFQEPTWKNVALAGLLLGLSSLTRPETYYISVLICIVMLCFFVVKSFKKKMVHPGLGMTFLVFTFTFFMVVSPWLVRNHVRFGSASIATTGIRNVYSSLAPSIISLKTGQPIHEVQKQLRLDFSQKYTVDEDVITTDPGLGKLLVQEGWKIVLENPAEGVGVLFINTMTFFTQDLYTTYLRHYGIIKNIELSFSPSLVLLKDGPIELMTRVWNLMGFLATVPVAGRLLWITITILMLVGIITASKKNNPRRFVAFFLATLVVIYWLGTISVGFSDHGRHRYKATPIIFVFGGYGLVFLIEKWKKPKNPKTSLGSPYQQASLGSPSDQQHGEEGLV